MKVGIDIIDVNRFERISGDDNLLSSLFTEKERAYFNKFAQRTIHIAGTFSAKEAVVKAFKTGFTVGIMPLDVEILHKDGVPYVNLKNGAKRHYEDNGYKNIDISISHTNSIAQAICIIEE